MRPRQRAAADPGIGGPCDCLDGAPGSGTTIRVLTIMDERTRAGMAVVVWSTTSAAQVIELLGALIATYGAPGHRRSENRPECVAQAVQERMAACDVQTLSIEPGKPWHNANEERFNGAVRDTCVILHLFHALAEARVRLDASCRHDKGARPYPQPGYITPLAFKAASRSFRSQATTRASDRCDGTKGGRQISPMRRRQPVPHGHTGCLCLWG